MENCKRELGTAISSQDLADIKAGREVQVVLPPAIVGKPKPRKDHITVTGMIYHQIVDQQPKAITIGYSRHLEGSEQLYHRLEKTPLDGSWAVVDTGWVKDPGLIVIINSHPTIELEIAIQISVQRIDYLETFIMPFALLSFQEDFKVHPVKDTKYLIRKLDNCNDTLVKYNLYAVER